MASILGNGTVTFGDGTSQSTTSFTGNVVVFTSTQNWTIPATRVKVTLIAGGGGGGTGYTSFYYAGGFSPTVTNHFTGGLGGYGAMTQGFVTGLTVGASITITVGIGGGSAAAGGVSSFGSYITTTAATAGGYANGIGGANGSATGGILNYLRNLHLSSTSVGLFGQAGAGSSSSTGGSGLQGLVIVEY
jgi:hypothetical protein